MSKHTITIEGVPGSITREQVVEALRILGIDASRVMSFSGAEGGTAMHVEVWADERPDDPDRRWSYDGKTVATHRLTIPILDKEDAA